VTHASFTPHFNAYRFYDDDGGEAASTPLANQDVDVNIDVDPGNQPFQVRIRVDETGGADGKAGSGYQIQYSKNSAAAINLTTTDSGDGIRAVAAGLTNDNSTTNRASPDDISDPGAGVFVAGEQSTDGLVDDMLLTTDNFTEHVYGIELVTANVTNNDTFDFSLSSPNGIVNNVVPTVTIIKTPAAGTALGLALIGVGA